MPRAASSRSATSARSTGPLAGFGEADGFILEQVRGILCKGLQSGGRTYQVADHHQGQPVERQPRRRSRVRADPRRQGRPASSPPATPDTTNPVADQAEVNEVPCITTNCPWQPYFFGRKGDPAKGFTWTYHFFWGLEDVIARVPRAVGRRADQQGRRRPVPQRRRRQRLGRSAARPAAGAGAGRLQAHRSRPLSADEQRLHRRRSRRSRRPAPRSSPAT